MALLIKPLAYDRESPGSILLRATQHNGWSSPTALISAHGIRTWGTDSSLLSFMCAQDRWKKLCSSLGITDPEVINCSYFPVGQTSRTPLNYMGIPILREKLRLNEPAICPKCLNEKDYLPAIWDLIPIHCCPIHQVRLITHCPSCEKPIMWNRRAPSICSCGFYFNLINPQKINSNASEYIETIVRHKDNEKLNRLFGLYTAFEKYFKQIHEDIEQYKLSELSVKCLKNKENGILLLKSFTRKQMKLLRIHPRILLLPFLKSEDSGIHELAIGALKNLPSKQLIKANSQLECLTETIDLPAVGVALGVSNHLAKKIALQVGYFNGTRSNISLASINDLLFKLSVNHTTHDGDTEKIYSAIHRPSNQRSLIGILRAILSDEITYSGMDTSAGILSVQIPIQNPRKRANELSIQQVAELCGVHYENIRFAVRCGILHSRTNKSTTRLINKADALAFNKRYIFAGCLAHQYVCNPTNLTEKIMSHGVNPVSGPSIDGGLAYLFKRSDLSGLDISAIIQTIKYPTQTGRKKEAPSTDDNIVYLAFAAEKLDIPIQTATRLMNKKYLVHVPSTNRQRNVTLTSLNALIKINEDTSLISLADAANCIGESVNMFRQRWIESQFIPLIDSGLTLYISPDSLQAIQKFKEKYLTAGEAGILTQTHRSHMANLEKAKKIKPAIQLFSRGRNINFYDRCEVLALVREAT